MVQRHKDELVDALPEVDLFLGSSEMDRLIPELERARPARRRRRAGRRIPACGCSPADLPHVRYLKISEGCDHGCAFCAIPLMRGKHRSFALDEIVREAQLLEAQGAREINLVAQDLAHYGRDRRDEKLGLPERARGARARDDHPVDSHALPLLGRAHAAAARADGDASRASCRISTCRSSTASDAVLARMRRPERQRTIRERVRRDSRDVVPDVAIRTTCIVGFPGRDRGRLRDAARVPRGDRSSSASARSRTRRRKARAPRRWTTTCPSGEARAARAAQRAAAADHGRAVRAARSAARCARSSIAWTTATVQARTRVAGRRHRRRDATSPARAASRRASFVDVRLDEVVDDVDFARVVCVRVVSAPPARARATCARSPCSARSAASDGERARSRGIMARARELFPGGVSSPVRAFRGVGGEPFVVERGEGARIWDVDGSEYIDYVLSWGPLVLGHAPPVVLDALRRAMRRGTSFGIPTELEVELAELDRRADAARRDAALRVERHRGDDERDARSRARRPAAT